MTARRHGHPQSKQARAKIAAANRGRKPSKATRTKLSKAAKGRKLSAKTRAKIAAALRARAAARKAAAKKTVVPAAAPKPVRVQVQRPVKPPSVAAIGTNFGATIAAPTHGTRGARLGVIRAARVRRGRPL